MPRFFVDKNCINDGYVTVSGADAVHISRSLRMAKGEHITVCDGESFEYDCELTDFGEDVKAKIICKRESDSEPQFKVTVWQALPKGDKLDSIIQKSVECGAYEIRLFESEHCIVKTDDKSEQKKSERRNRIALEAAKQSGRSRIPKVESCCSFASMIAQASKADVPMFCYEAEGTEPLGRVLSGYSGDGLCGKHISVVIGPEGGFSQAEARLAKESGMIMVGLGKRILRTETVSGFVLGALVCLIELS